jgi:hypothetical protein
VGSAMWSDRFCSGPLPVLAAWLQKPRKASMARRPFLTCSDAQSQPYPVSCLGTPCMSRVWSIFM